MLRTGTSSDGFQVRSGATGSSLAFLAAHSAMETNRPLRTSPRVALSWRRARTTYSARTTTTEIRLKVGLIRNMTKTQPTSPRKGTRRGTVKVGRKLTMLNVCSISTTRLSIP